jgi:hypothetical protein
MCGDSCGTRAVAVYHVCVHSGAKKMTVITRVKFGHP